MHASVIVKEYKGSEYFSAETRIEQRTKIQYQIRPTTSPHLSLSLFKHSQHTCESRWYKTLSSNEGSTGMYSDRLITATIDFIYLMAASSDELQTLLDSSKMMVASFVDELHRVCRMSRYGIKKHTK